MSILESDSNSIRSSDIEKQTQFGYYMNPSFAYPHEKTIVDNHNITSLPQIDVAKTTMNPSRTPQLPPMDPNKWSKKKQQTPPPPNKLAKLLPHQAMAPSPPTNPSKTAPPPPRSSMLLAGHLAYTYLTKGTLSDQLYDPATQAYQALETFNEMENNPTQNMNHSAFRLMLERDKLAGPNLNDWYHQLSIVPRVEKKTDVFENQMATALVGTASNEELTAYNSMYDRYNEVSCLMFGSMTPKLQKQCELYNPNDMINELKSVYEKQPGVELFDLIQSLHDCKHDVGKPVSSHVLKMKNYLEHLQRLNYGYHQPIAVSIILNSLSKDFESFVRNYNMHNMGKTIVELHAMLIDYEKNLPKKSDTPQVLMIKGGKVNKPPLTKGKNKRKGKGKQVVAYVPKPKKTPPAKKEHPAKNELCHHCFEVGHWRRNCPAYLAELMKKRKQAAGLTDTSEA